MENYTESGKAVERWLASRTDNVLIYRMDRKVLDFPRHPLPSIENPRVDGSIPPLATNTSKARRDAGLFVLGGLHHYVTIM